MPPAQAIDLSRAREEYIFSHERIEQIMVSRVEWSPEKANAMVEVARARYAVPARWFAGAVVAALAVLVCGVVAVACIDMPWQAKVGGFLAIAAGVGASTTVIFRKLLERFGGED